MEEENMKYLQLFFTIIWSSEWGFKTWPIECHYDLLVSILQVSGGLRSF